MGLRLEDLDRGRIAKSMQSKVMNKAPASASRIE
jgi:hypothetical protein